LAFFHPNIIDPDIIIPSGALGGESDFLPIRRPGEMMVDVVDIYRPLPLRV